jgi:hypothetical protein
MVFISHISLFLFILIKQRVLSFSSESAYIGPIRLSPIKGLWSMNRLLGIRLVIFRREKDESIL